MSSTFAPINKILMSLSKRAEKFTPEHIVKSFVDVGSVSQVLLNRDNQILYGRRGTGKTHVLSYLNNLIKEKNTMCIQIDMRILGSTGGIYADAKIPITERATRLLSDTLCQIHDEILDYILNDPEERYDLSKLGPHLDKLIDEATHLEIKGEINTEEKTCNTGENKQSLGIGVKASNNNLSITSNMNAHSITSNKSESIVTRKGSDKIRIHFGSIGKYLDRIVSCLNNKQLWILFDEWSEIPLDLQPFLADMLRRTVFPYPNIVVKIAAIEQRSKFRHYLADDGYHIGLEVGADISTSLDLDYFMVFDNDNSASKEFFKNLLYKHVLASSQNDFPDKIVIPDKKHFIQDVFTQEGAFEEFVKASEGVPRDAINIISKSAQKAVDQKISIQNIRICAANWYIESKYKNIQTKHEAIMLLEWIIQNVIGQKKARAFLLKKDERKNERDYLIDFLFDERVLHLIKQNVSTQNAPGVRFNVYSIDYGCYVELINTSKAPEGELNFNHGDTESYISVSEVPNTDFRCIKNSILDLSQFYPSI